MGMHVGSGVPRLRTAGTCCSLFMLTSRVVPGSYLGKGRCLYRETPYQRAIEHPFVFCLRNQVESSMEDLTVFVVDPRYEFEVAVEVSVNLTGRHDGKTDSSVIDCPSKNTTVLRQTLVASDARYSPVSKYFI